ncbi:glycosyltransferase [Chengkuizengella axinellae]|uniref:Glycosyltransferase n=1 Tax=Chengkuizengella axinellae TaxID=3064388 RepID=A0ABT9IZH8_9BACL|nr:glycosyltransferase [Chengkuizengella sp. 2205SS18-9]MDP5274737.1 glycosyltransferase [Chengkuizengella sp. 2205SS18-9]
MKKSIVLYIGNFSFPVGNAAGKRVYANGKLLNQLGYEVIFIGMDKEIDQSQSLESTKKVYDNFVYYNFPYPNKNIDWMNYRKVFDELESLLRDQYIIDNLSFVIYYGSPRLSFFNTKLIDFCKKQKIKVIADCVDWLTVKTNNSLFNIVKWFDNNYQKAYANKKADGIIAISKYLSNYYNKYGCKTVIIPPLSPENCRPTSNAVLNNDKKIITYAGIPFRRGKQVKDVNNLKDRIDKTIKLFYRAKKSGCDFTFNIYGFSKDEYLEAIPMQKKYVEELGESIIFHGHKPNDYVVNSVINSDFTILIRDVNRDTSAGFPTKVSESISSGTPVITTKTSDLEDYIVDGKNGYFLSVNNEEKNLKEIIEILRTDRVSINKMKLHCRENNLFYFKHFQNQLNCFLNSLI